MTAPDRVGRRTAPFPSPVATASFGMIIKTSPLTGADRERFRAGVALRIVIRVSFEAMWGKILVRKHSDRSRIDREFPSRANYAQLPEHML